MGYAAETATFWIVTLVFAITKAAIEPPSG